MLIRIARPGTGPALRVGLVAALGFVLLAVAVRTGLLDDVDTVLRDLARPGDGWGRVQVDANRVVEAGRPPVAVGLLVALTAAVCLARRSWRPALLPVVGSLLTAAGTIGTKLLLHRLDPHGAPSDDGGSFPSGHTASVLFCVGMAVLLLRPDPPRRWWLLPAVAAATMATALVLEGAHWVTDVLGGALLAATVLSACRAAVVRESAIDPDTVASSSLAPEALQRAPDASQ